MNGSVYIRYEVLRNFRMAIFVVPSLAFPLRGASPLTFRERDVLVAARPGATVSEIAEKLFLSEGTIRNRAQAVRTADEQGWLLAFPARYQWRAAAGVGDNVGAGDEARHNRTADAVLMASTPLNWPTGFAGSGRRHRGGRRRRGIARQ